MAIQLTIGGATKRSVAGTHEVSVDFDALPQASKDFLIRYGIKQYLADGAAGVKTNADLKAGVDERLKKLAEGTMAQRSGGGDKGPSSDVDVVARQLARNVIRDKAKAAGVTLGKDKLAELLAKLMEAKGDDYRKQAQAAIAERAKRAAEVLAMADDEAFAELFAEGDEPEGDAD